MAVVTVLITATGAGSFTIPAGVTSLSVELWGPGASGAGNGSSQGAGGNGGDFVVGAKACTPGQIVYYDNSPTVAWMNIGTNSFTFGNGSIAAGPNGTGNSGSTTWTGVTTTAGGAGAAAQGGGGGSRAGSGGGGAAGPLGVGGVGAAGASSTPGTGGTANNGNTAAGVANVEGGGGATGATSTVTAAAGAAPGGGGGGSGASGGLASAGGRGQIRYTYTEPDSVIDQDSFRFRDDNGTETTATWLAAVNTTVALTVGQTFRLRFLLQETSAVALSDGYKIQFRPAAGSWADVLNSSGAIQAGTSANVTNLQATTQQLGVGTFVAGDIVEDNGTTGLIALTASAETEIEAVLEVAAGAGGVYELRLVKDDGSVLNSYTNTPSISTPLDAITGGALSTITVTPTGASVSVDVSAGGALQTVSVTALTGSAETSNPVSITPVLPTAITVTPHIGTATGTANATAPPAAGDITVTPLAGTASANISASTGGPLETVTVTAPGGTATGTGAAAGSLPGVTVTALAGSAEISNPGNAAPVLSGVTVTPLAGTATASAPTSGSLETITVTAPGGSATGVGDTTGSLPGITVTALGGTGVATKLYFPASDISAGAWVSTGATLAAVIDEAVIDDVDYMSTPSPSVAVVAFGAIPDPGVDEGLVLYYRAASDNGTRTLRVALRQGATLIAEETRLNISSTETTYTFNIPAVNAANITNFADLRLELEFVAGG